MSNERKKPYYKMSEKEIILELKKIFVEQIKNKEEKFLSTQKNGSQDSPYDRFLNRLDLLNKTIEYADNWQSNLTYLKYLESFLVDTKEKNDQSNYFRLVISLVYNVDSLSSEMIDRIVNDPILCARISELKAELINKKQSLEIIPEQVDQLKFIVGLLDDSSETDYLDEELINMIYSYCQSEQYINYADKIINIGTLIINYNILAHQKRSLR